MTDQPPRIQASSQTRWATLPESLRTAVVDAVVTAGHGKTEIVQVAVITCAVWEWLEAKADQPEEILGHFTRLGPAAYFTETGIDENGVRIIARDGDEANLLARAVRVGLAVLGPNY